LADWKDFDWNSAPGGTEFAQVRILPVQNGNDGDMENWLPPLRLRLADGWISDSVDARLRAEILRRLGMSEDSVVESMGYSPRPVNDGE
jgi:hypothetical protein